MIQYSYSEYENFQTQRVPISRFNTTYVIERQILKCVKKFRIPQEKVAVLLMMSKRLLFVEKRYTLIDIR